MDDREKFFRLPSGSIRGGEEDSLRFEERQGGFNQRAEIFLDAEGTKFFGLGKGGRVDQDGIKETLFFCEAAKPVENVAVNKFVLFGSELVQLEIALAPIEIFF